MALAAVALAACTGSGGGGGANKAAGGASGDGGSRAGISDAGASAPKPAAPALAQGVKAPVIEDGTAKIRVAQMTVDVRRGGVPAAADRAGTIALGAGGEIDADNRTSGRFATASLQLRVPPEALQSVLRQLSGLGHESSRALSTTDVTQKVADVKSRVQSAQDSITQLRTLYASAHKVSDLIAIESELNSREADLESLQAQQRTLQRQTAMSTIGLTLQTATPAASKPVQHHHRGGFLGGLERGWDGFVSAATWVATALGTVLPFLALLAVLALAGRLLWRRLPHRPQPAPAPSE